MSTQSNNNKRIAKNALLFYFRMLFMMVVLLYMTRVILNALGVEYFGIYNALGGVVAISPVISEMLTTAISRFNTYDLGEESEMTMLNRRNKCLAALLFVTSPRTCSKGRFDF